MKFVIPLMLAALSAGAGACPAQQAGAPQTAQSLQEQLGQLTRAINATQAQVDASQRQLLELRKSLAALELRLGSDTQATPAPAAESPAPSASALDQQTERAAMQAAQIATLDQAKVESESKYPVKITGLLLFNGFVNSRQVDTASVPAIALSGSGSAGATLRQTILGVDARGPRLAGANSHADLRIDFFGDEDQNTYNNAGGLLRLRTAHGTLDWRNTQVFFALDRPILSPNTPSSLTALASPPLAWSGNLWTWSPQVGVTQTVDFGRTLRLAVQAALIDVPDPPSATTTVVPAAGAVTQAQATREPGSELHLTLLGNQKENGPSLGVGGYFSPHRTPQGFAYNAWASTLDAHVLLPRGLEFSGSFYRGAALGGLGGGGYKDYLYISVNGRPYSRALDDVGGWTQIKKHAGTHLEFNAAAGFDNPFAKELSFYQAYLSSPGYQSVARNRTFFGNFIYSPSSYLIFSFEYRYITTYPTLGVSAASNIFGLAAGYRF